MRNLRRNSTGENRNDLPAAAEEMPGGAAAQVSAAEAQMNGAEGERSGGAEAQMNGAAACPDVVSLYQLADDSGIYVYWYTLHSELESMVVELGPGVTAIALDPMKFESLGDEKYKLAHELGHSFTGSLYRRRTPLDERGRNERRADRWAIEHLLPFEALKAAVEAGCVEPAELAEQFQLPQKFVEMAVGYYTGPKGLRFGDA